MKTALTVFVSGLAFAAAMTLVAAGSPKHETLAPPPAAQSAYAQVVDSTGPVQVLVFTPLYGSSPRIIHVPQKTDRTEASANVTNTAVADIDDNVPTPAREPLIKRIKRSPVEPDARAALAEPKKIEDLSPVYPTPRYSTDAAVKEAAPDVAPERAPPVGYMPPSSLSPRN